MTQVCTVPGLTTDPGRWNRGLAWACFFPCKAHFNTRLMVEAMVLKKNPSDLWMEPENIISCITLEVSIYYYLTCFSGLKGLTVSGAPLCAASCFGGSIYIYCFFGHLRINPKSLAGTAFLTIGQPLYRGSIPCFEGWDRQYCCSTPGKPSKYPQEQIDMIDFTHSRRL